MLRESREAGARGRTESAKIKEPESMRNILGKREREEKERDEER
jgi:hypothetical protein